MQWQKAVLNNESQNYKIPESWLFIHYYEALNTLFRFENSLRLFVYIILKREFSNKWLEISLETEDGANTTIAAISKRRKSIDDNYGYIGFNIYSPMLYLTSGELIRIVLHDKYWKYFNNYFPGSKEVIRNKLDEISNVRNDLAHFRPIKEDDVEVVKQNVKHIMQSIEQYLFNLFNIDIRVPTNYEEAWFKEIRKVSNEYCSLEIMQNVDNEYINISLKYKIPILRKTKYYKSMTLAVLNFNSIDILDQQTLLTEKSIYITETSPSLYKEDSLDNKIIKSINFIFPRTILSTDYTSIITEFESLIQKMQHESDMIIEDNSSRGDFLFLHNVNVTIDITESKEQKYTIHGSTFTSNPKSAPIEYWGTNAFYWNKDIISNIDTFPWMPVAISNADIPF